MTTKETETPGWTENCEAPVKAIEFAVYHIGGAEGIKFLEAWDNGDVSEWPDFIEFVEAA